MLTIGKIGKAKAQQQYYEESVAKSREDYYAGSGEAPGEFFGEGSRALGLSGQSSMENLTRLFAGQNPATGEQLRSMKGNVQVHGLDLTFSAPKSVSILYALGDADLQRHLVEAHEWAVDQAITYMERDSARVVRGHKASKADLAAGIEDTLRDASRDRVCGDPLPPPGEPAAGPAPAHPHGDRQLGAGPRRALHCAGGRAHL